MYYSTFFTHIEEAIEAVELAVGGNDTQRAINALKGELRQINDVKQATANLCGSGFRLHSDVEQLAADIECVIHKHEQYLSDQSEESLIIKAHEEANRFTGELMRIGAQ